MPVISIFLLFITLAISALLCVMEAASIPRRKTTPIVTKNSNQPTHGFILLLFLFLLIVIIFSVFSFQLSVVSCQLSVVSYQRSVISDQFSALISCLINFFNRYSFCFTKF